MNPSSRTSRLRPLAAVLVAAGGCGIAPTRAADVPPPSEPEPQRGVRRRRGGRDQSHLPRRAGRGRRPEPRCARRRADVARVATALIKSLLLGPEHRRAGRRGWSPTIPSRDSSCCRRDSSGDVRRPSTSRPRSDRADRRAAGHRRRPDRVHGQRDRRRRAGADLRVDGERSAWPERQPRDHATAAHRVRLPRSRRVGATRLPGGARRAR